MTEFSYQYRVCYADTDQMGVVYYANYYVFFERFRTELLRNSGLPYKQLEADGVMLPVIESHCNYISPARYDDLLSIEGRVSLVKGCRVTIECELYRDETLLAKGYTIHACMSTAGKLVKPTKSILNLYSH